MIGPLEHVARAWHQSERSSVRGAYYAAVLSALKSRAGRMLGRSEIKRLCPSVPSREMQSILNRLEKADRIVVDREERPVLYGVLP